MSNQKSHPTGMTFCFVGAMGRNRKLFNSKYVGGIFLATLASLQIIKEATRID